MIAKTQNNGRTITGICIGISDARRYFPRRTKTIDLELDHLRIRCDLKASFWRDCPEISDPRLSAWLEAKFFGQKLPASPFPVEMVKAGDAYKLHLLPAQHQAKTPGFGLIA